MTFKIAAAGRSWKAVFAAMDSLHEEGLLRLQEDGIVTRLMDPSTKEYLGFFWPKENMAEYGVEDKVIDLPISIKNFYATAKRFGDDATVTLQENGKSYLFTDGSKEFTLNRIWYDKEMVKELNVPYMFGTEIELKKFSEVKQDVEMFGIDVFNLQSREGKIFYEGSEQTGGVRGTLLDKCPVAIQKTGFSLAYLQPFIDGVKAYVEPNVWLELGEEVPLHLVLTVPQVTKLHYFLAPVVR